MFPQPIAVPALNMAGFGAGITASMSLLKNYIHFVPGILSPVNTDRKRLSDSIAAIIHSSIGNVASGSLFAILQSAGAGGAGAAVVFEAVQFAGSAAAVAAALHRLRAIKNNA